MVNRWVEFVKNYSKENNMSYTCAMCDIKTKGIYTPLKKEIKKDDEEERKKLIDEFKHRLNETENRYYGIIYAFISLEKRKPPLLERELKILKINHKQYRIKLEELTGKEYPNLKDEKNFKKEMKKYEKEEEKKKPVKEEGNKQINDYNFDSIRKKKTKGVILE